MDLEFEIENQILKRTDSQVIYNKDYNNYDCIFDFGDDNEWSSIDKYVIFKDGWGNKITIHLGEEDSIVSCPLPNKMLKGSLFKVYALGGELKTNQVNMVVNYSSFPKPCSVEDVETDDGYEYDNHTVHVISDCNRPHRECSETTVECNKNEIDVFTEIFNRLKTLVDNVEYNDKEVLFYNGDTLLETVSLPFLTRTEIQNLITENLEEDLLSNLPNATSNQHGLLSAEDKDKLDNLSTVALTGEYNDLNNIPSDFNPSPHNHIVEDVTNYEETFNSDLNLLLDLLSDEISKN